MIKISDIIKIYCISHSACYFGEAVGNGVLGVLQGEGALLHNATSRTSEVGLLHGLTLLFMERIR